MRSSLRIAWNIVLICYIILCLQAYNIREMMKSVEEFQKEIDTRLHS